MRLSVALLLLLAPLALATSSGELTALSDLFYACDGDGWLDNSNWLMGDPCDNSTFSWYGVSCENDHVVGLYLNDNQLVGTLPSSMENLYEADTFSLYNNEISGTIPENWSGIRTLVKVDLHGNLLSGTIPDSLGDLLDYNLNYLDLSDNELSGNIPSFFDGAEKDFVYVDLSGNRFVCPIPSWANYTQATCVELTIEATQPPCVEDGLSYVVFGSNFLGLDDLECTLLDMDTGDVISSTPATVIGDKLLQCIAKYQFASCNGTSRSYLYTHSQLVLTYEGLVVTDNSTLVTLGVVNPLCPVGPDAWVTDSNGVRWVMPGSASALLALCESAKTSTPWSCPSSIPAPSDSSFIPPTLDPNCENSDNTTCLWAFTGYAETPGCPMFQCSPNGCTFPDSCQAASSTYYGPMCYTANPTCDDTC